MMALIMVKEGVLSETELKEPLNRDFIDSLNVSSVTKQHLIDNQVTLYQLMTHTAGLGDYLNRYSNAVLQGDCGVITRPEEFLNFTDEKLSPVSEYRYSNTGILLAGLALQHTYEKKHGPCEYNHLLQKYIVDIVDMPSFSISMPENARFNLQNPVPNISGSPAGGYWITSEDLAKFGKWLYEKCKDPEFLVLVKNYGQEFYNEKYNLICHSGAIESASAYLSVSLNTGAVIATLSNQTDMAIEMHSMIQTHVFLKPKAPSLDNDPDIAQSRVGP